MKNVTIRMYNHKVSLQSIIMAHVICIIIPFMKTHSIFSFFPDILPIQRNGNNFNFVFVTLVESVKDRHRLKTRLTAFIGKHKHYVFSFKL